MSSFSHTFAHDFSPYQRGGFVIGLVAHSEKPASAAVVQAMTGGLAAAGVPFLLEKSTAPLAGCSSNLDVNELARECELLVVMGGDGTILRVLHKLDSAIPPVFGINIGSLGFLTCLGPSEVGEAVESIRTRSYLLSCRRLLQVELRCTSGEVRQFHALNDAVIGRGERSELVKIRVSVDAVPLTEYNADGLIVATPTGSTAYSLSAGGPILTPDSGSLVVTPICPHVLTNRSVVISDASVVEVSLAEQGHMVFLTVDGQDTCGMGVGDILRLSRSGRELPLAMLPGRSFSEVLRQKLKWTGSNI